MEQSTRNPCGYFGGKLLFCSRLINLCVVYDDFMNTIFRHYFYQYIITAVVNLLIHLSILYRKQLIWQKSRHTTHIDLYCNQLPVFGECCMARCSALVTSVKEFKMYAFRCKYHIEFVLLNSLLGILAYALDMHMQEQIVLWNNLLSWLNYIPTFL